MGSSRNFTKLLSSNKSSFRKTHEKAALSTNMVTVKGLSDVLSNTATDNTDAIMTGNSSGQ